MMARSRFESQRAEPPQLGDLVEECLRIVAGHAQLELDLEVVLESHATPFGRRATHLWAGRTPWARLIDSVSLDLGADLRDCLLRLRLEERPDPRARVTI